jgi:hypothetical protein
MYTGVLSRVSVRHRGSGRCRRGGGLWKRSVSAAATVMMVYLSHPMLDYVTGNKPLWLGGPSMGLGVIQRPVASDGAPR